MIPSFHQKGTQAKPACHKVDACPFSAYRSLFGGHLRGNLLGKVVLALFDTLAALEALEADHIQLRADLLGDLAHQLGDGLVRILDEGLLQEANLLIVLLDAALDHLVHDLLGLALVERLGAEDLTLLVERLGGNLFLAHIAGLGSGDLQRDVMIEGAEGVGAKGSGIVVSTSSSTPILPPMWI